MSLKFSILTPSHNEKLLSKCFEQIDNQTYNNYEHLVALDRPNMKYVNNNDKRRIFNCKISHKNFGNSCRNFLSFFAKGDVILYYDHDDYVKKNLLKRLAFHIEKNPEYVWGYSKTYINSDDPEQKMESFPENLDSSNLLTSSLTLNQIFHRRIVDGKPIRYYEGNSYIGDKLTVGQYLIHHKPLKINEVLTLHSRYNFGRIVEEWRT